jgi:hypothetical protein
VVITSVPFLKTRTNGFFGNVQVQVVDAHDRPVSGVPIFFSGVDVGDAGPPGPWRSSGRPRAGQPGAQFDYARVVTNENGRAGTGVSANEVAGTALYAAYFRHAGKLVKGFFVLSNRGDAIEAATTVPVVEFFHAALGHYFMTANGEEMAALDSGALAGWARTGGVFLAYPASTGLAPRSAVPVCRFYGRPEAGLDSHFFTAKADECARVQVQFATSWTLETSNAFLTQLPHPLTGECPSSTQRVHRYFNMRPDANHRYVVDGPALEQMRASGFASEGDGPFAVVMCAPV